MLLEVLFIVSKLLFVWSLVFQKLLNTCFDNFFVYQIYIHLHFFRKLKIKNTKNPMGVQFTKYLTYKNPINDSQTGLYTSETEKSIEKYPQEIKHFINVVLKLILKI